MSTEPVTSGNFKQSNICVIGVSKGISKRKRNKKYLETVAEFFSSLMKTVNPEMQRRSVNIKHKRH